MQEFPIKFKTQFQVAPLHILHPLSKRGHRWIVYPITFSSSIRRFRSKRKAFAWAAREARRVGGVVRDFHKMTSRQRKYYWRSIKEQTE